MEQTWSDIAGWYDDLVRAGSGPHETAVRCLLGLVPPSLAGQEVLDVACGQGLATRALASAGAARVVGVDSSPEMIARAQLHESLPGGSVEYVVDDAQTLASLGPGSFDGATCQLALMDIPDLDATLASVVRVVRPGGWFAFVIGHPCFLMPDARPLAADDGRPALVVRGYFDERFWRSANPQGVRRAGNHHRTLTTYLNALTHAGLTTEEVAEPVATGRLAAERPLYREVPIFFAARTRRAG
ncbi:MAG TPA: methyltransferase domain-containing protein [Acidimicrobiales bacterium]